MKRHNLAERLARSARLSKPDAADRLDRVVHDILRSLKRGERVALPGLGTFIPGKNPAFQFEPRGPAKGSRRGRR